MSKLELNKKLKKPKKPRLLEPKKPRLLKPKPKLKPMSNRILKTK